MGDERTYWKGISFTPRAGVGFLTDGRLVNFNSPYPHGTTRLLGGEISVDFAKILPETRRIGELAFTYYWGHAQDTVTQDDLPLGDLGNLLRFNSERETNSHFIMAEWRWPSYAPVWSNGRWSFINPQFGLGAGGIFLNSRITQNDRPPKEATDFAAVATGSTQVKLVEYSYGSFQVSLEGAVRLFAGMAFGMMGEGALRFTYRRF